MTKRNDRPTLYICYKWFLDNASDEDLKARGCDSNTVETMHILHDEIASGKSHTDTMKKRKVNKHSITMMERLYEGESKRHSKVAAAYEMLLGGKSEAQLMNENFTRLEIQKAKEFQDKYQHRDIFACVVARDLSIPKQAVCRMQRSFSDFQAMRM